MQRIRRLLDRPEAPRRALTPIFSAGILMLTAAVVLTAWPSKAGGKAPAQVASPAPAAPQRETTARPLSERESEKREEKLRNELETPYRKWLNEDVAYIITDEERTAYKRLQTNEEREHFIEQFWLRRDPTPGTPRNEFKEEHYRRIAYANEHYASRIPGWKTDRGRIYIIYGPPDEINAHRTSGTVDPSSEQWRYRFIEGVGTNVIIEFVDSTGTGEYRMTLDPSEKDALNVVLGPSGGHVFASSEPGARVTVMITSDRRMLIRIPIDFEAKQYDIYGRTLRADTGAVVRVFEEMRSLCKDAPGTAGCLSLPVFQPVPAAILEPGSYVFAAVVKDRAGTTLKTYTVNFTVE